MRKRELDGAFALIKFSRREERLRELIGGKIYCRTAEFYRACEAEGVGDASESAALALREGKGLEDWEIRVDGRAIDGVTQFTMWTGDSRDQWLHSWTILRMPSSHDELESLVANLNRLRTEFGPYYVVVSAERILELLRRIDKAAPNGASLREVQYENSGATGSPTCKNARFSYQAEARFLMGDCPLDENAEMKFQIEGGLEDILLLNPEIKIVHNTARELLLLMDVNGIRSDGENGEGAEENA